MYLYIHAIVFLGIYVNPHKHTHTLACVHTLTHTCIYSNCSNLSVSAVRTNRHIVTTQEEAAAGTCAWELDLWLILRRESRPVQITTHFYSPDDGTGAEDEDGTGSGNVGKGGRVKVPAELKGVDRVLKEGICKCVHVYTYVN